MVKTPKDDFEIALELLPKIQAALGTEATGDALVEVASNAHRAEQEWAAGRKKSNNFDVNGREYARVADVKCGDILEIDGDFTCMEEGLHVACGKDNEHHLVVQLSHGGTHYVGIYKVDP